MLKLLNKSAIAMVTTLSISTAAHADINTSLQTVCSNATAIEAVELDKKLQQVDGDYRAKLMSFYQGVSCEGKTLLHTALNDSEENAEDMAIRNRS